jgi:chromosome segregation ATPase
MSPPPSSARRSPMHSSEPRNRKSAVHFESSQTKDQTQSQLSPLPDHISALKQLEKQKLKDFASPTALRVSEGANDLDLSTPLASSNPAINRAFASLAKAAGTPYETPARGWPARFRHELELLKTAMETYSASHQQAMQALAKEKEKSSSLAEQKALLEQSMHDKLTEMERVKSLMEMRASETEERLQALRHQIVSQEVHDSEVSAQLAKLEEAKSALQGRAARASEEADALRQQLSSARAECSSLQEARQHLELRVQEIGSLQERMRRVAAAKEESERELGRLGAHLREVQSEAKAAGSQVQMLKTLLQDNDSKHARLELEIKSLNKEKVALNKEKAAVIEQLRAADRSGREAREEGQQLVREWQQRHAELEASLDSKSSQVVSIERTCKSLRKDLAAAEAREQEEALKLAKMTEMKEALETQIAHLTAVDRRRQQEKEEVQQAVRSLEARLQHSEAEMAELRLELSRTEQDKAEIEEQLEARSTELAQSALRQREALDSICAKDAQLVTISQQSYFSTVSW